MKIVFLEPLGLKVETIKESCKGLIDKGHEVIIFPDRNENIETLIERAKDAEILVESNIPLRKIFLDACPKLKMLSIAFTGLDHIDIEECNKRNIKVMNAAGYSTQAMAELTISLMIDVYRNIIDNNKITRSCKANKLVGREIGGKTIGIIGMGAVGQKVASLAQAFGCHVIAYNRTKKEMVNIPFVDKDTLLRNSDVITLHLALNNETRNFITAGDFEKMKPSAILINTARGPVVNEQDLANALINNKISGAAVDVYNQEPPLKSDNPLFEAPNLIMLPHIGFATHEAFEHRLEIVVNNIENSLNI